MLSTCLSDDDDDDDEEEEEEGREGEEEEEREEEEGEGVEGGQDVEEWEEDEGEEQGTEDVGEVRLVCLRVAWSEVTWLSMACLSVRDTPRTAATADAQLPVAGLPCCCTHASQSDSALP